MKDIEIIQYVKEIKDKYKIEQIVLSNGAAAYIHGLKDELNDLDLTVTENDYLRLKKHPDFKEEITKTHINYLILNKESPFTEITIHNKSGLDVFNIPIPVNTTRFDNINGVDVATHALNWVLYRAVKEDVKFKGLNYKKYEIMEKKYFDYLIKNKIV